MKILKLLIVFMLIGLMPAFANQRRAEVQQLTISGTAVNAYLIASNTTVTSDSIYVRGNDGFQSLAITLGGNAGGMTVDTQVSYDNSTWWTPYVATNGTLTSIGRVATGMTANRWISFPWTVAPYIRFDFVTGAVTNDTVTADTIWQDES